MRSLKTDVELNGNYPDLKTIPADIQQLGAVAAPHGAPRRPLSAAGRRHRRGEGSGFFSRRFKTTKLILIST